MSQFVQNWKEIKDLVDALELDVVKNGERGNRAAGVRVRKGLRHVKSLAGALVKLSVTLDKEAKADPTPEPTV